MTMSIAGYAIVWGDVAQLENVREQFEPGAFVNGSARLVFGHDPRPGAILGFARVAQDRHGARFSVELDEHRRDVRQVICAVRNGLNSCSFRFKPLASRKSGDLTVVERARLIEISIVGDPAYQAGGCWLAGDEPSLPLRLAALAEVYGTAPPLAARRPPETVRIELRPRSRLQHGPVQAALHGYMARYLARALWS